MAQPTQPSATTAVCATARGTTLSKAVHYRTGMLSTICAHWQADSWGDDCIGTEHTTEDPNAVTCPECVEMVAVQVEQSLCPHPDTATGSRGHILCFECGLCLCKRCEPLRRTRAT